MYGINSDVSYGIVGAGAWGTAFGNLAATNNKVVIWDRNIETVNLINSKHINSKCFPKLLLPVNLTATNDIDIILECDIIVIAIPFQEIRNFLISRLTGKFIEKSFLILSKGIEIGSCATAHIIVSELLPHAKCAVLSGPNFASEIAEGLPAVSQLASKNEKLLEMIKNSLLPLPAFQIRLTDDIIGVEICGAVKNVIAIAVGICAGAGYGENAKAALMVQSISELSQIVQALGGNADTVNGIAGIGDLILTCNSLKSRNFEFGTTVGKNGSVGRELSNGKTVEGIHTLQAVHNLTKKLDLNLPIINEVYNVVYKNKKINEAMQSLMNIKN